MKKRTLYTLYLVTDSTLCQEKEFISTIEKAIEGGVTLVQLREKTADTGEFYRKALRVKQITDAYHIPLLINDRIDIMQAVDADGVHLGQSDMPLTVARQMIGPHKIIGISATTEEEAREAEAEGADYLGVGAVFPTETKKDAHAVTIEELIKIKKAVHIPVVAIGGIHENTVTRLQGTGIDGIAVVSELMASDEPKKTARKLKETFLSIKSI